MRVWRSGFGVSACRRNGERGRHPWSVAFPRPRDEADAVGNQSVRPEGTCSPFRRVAVSPSRFHIDGSRTFLEDEDDDENEDSLPAIALRDGGTTSTRTKGPLSHSKNIDVHFEIAADEFLTSRRDSSKAYGNF